MASHIEQAKSGRSACKGCQEPIAQGELRLGEEVLMSGRPTTRWFHLSCAASARPAVLKDALAAYEGEIPERAHLLKLIDQPAEPALAEGVAEAFPFAERPAIASRCDRCGQTIAAGGLRVAEALREDHGTFVRLGARHFHPACARTAGLDSNHAVRIRANSRSVGTTDLDEIDAALSAATPKV